MSNDINFEDEECVVFGHNDFCQTAKAKWICIENIYEKFHRPNMYDLGASYIEDVPDYWFLFSTRAVGDIFLLDLFVNRHHEKSFKIAVAGSSELRFDKKSNIMYLDLELKNYNKIKECETSVFITTYNFSSYDIKLLKNKKLYIPISFCYSVNSVVDNDVLDNIKFNHDYGALLNDPYGSDFTMESSEGEKFYVHKILLSACSDVFKAMLKEETAECQNGYVKLVDVCKEDLKYILEFIYTGTVKQLESGNCMNLLMLADRYNLLGLKDVTQHVLCFQITKQNAFEILVLADMYNAEMLKNAALKFIKRYSSILGNIAFKEVKNAELARELCKYLAA